MTEPIRADHHRMAPQPRRRSPLRPARLILLIAVSGYLAWRVWAPQPDPPPASAAGDTAAPAAIAVPADQAPSGPLHPVESPADTAPQASAAPTLERALAELLGQSSWQSVLGDRLAQRIVATVDNLARSHAPAGMWPVAPTAGRFQVRQQGDGTLAVDPANDARYASFVSLAESIDQARLVALYARFYPLFQSAYGEIGFPGQHFNDRLVAVIDHLIQAPRPAQPVAITLVEVRGDTPAARPWVRYEFTDPALEALSAGQKIMIRVGPGNRSRLEALLVELRRRVADGALAAGR